MPNISNIIRRGKRFPALLAVVCLFTHALVSAQQVASGPRSNVILTSLDGLGYRIWSDDPATQELRALRRIAAHGVHAEGMIQAFPSVTPAGHSAVWTGTYGNVSGIVTSSNPMLPRSEHTILDRQSGFHPQQLWAEPIWLTAARQGVRVVAHQATQNYPFNASSTGSLSSNPPILVSGYGPAQLEPYAVIRPARTSPEDAGVWQPALPRSALPVKAFSWKVQNVMLHGALVAEHGRAKGYTAMYVAADTGGPRVRVAFAPTERISPRGRTLARFFSPPLHLTLKDAPTVGYFRLFELKADGSDFMLLQMPLHRLALYDGKTDDLASVPLLKAAGGFVGNGPGHMYQEGLMGAQLYAGGDGTAERRYLEGMELVMRQFNRHTQWLWKRYAPQLLIDYSPYPDEMEHTFYGLSRPDITGFDATVAQKIAPYRRWGYAVIDTRVALLDSLAGRKGNIVFFSDHGMAPVAKDVSINLALQRAGLLAYDSGGKIDIAHTQAAHNKFGVMINTKDWRGGIVAPEDRNAIVDQVEKVLLGIVDPQTGKAVVTGTFRPETHGKLLGIGGDAGADIYFDLAPGYGVSDKSTTDLITTKRAPIGEHGFQPTRDDMLASFIARGPKFAHGTTIPLMHSIDVSSAVSDLLGISPPAQNVGTSPFASRRP